MSETIRNYNEGESAERYRSNWERIFGGPAAIPQADGDPGESQETETANA